MKSLVKIAISLLITVVLFSGFAFLAFSGLFDYIESHFYNQRVERIVVEEVVQAHDSVSDFHKANFERFKPVLDVDAIRSRFST